MGTKFVKKIDGLLDEKGLYYYIRKDNTQVIIRQFIDDSALLTIDLPKHIVDSVDMEEKTAEYALGVIEKINSTDSEAMEGPETWTFSMPHKDQELNVAGVIIKAFEILENDQSKLRVLNYVESRINPECE